MPTSRCPRCQVILTDDEAVAARCPVCAAALRDEPPPQPQRNRWLLAPLAALTALALAVAAWRAWPTAETDDPSELLAAPARITRDLPATRPETPDLPEPFVEAVEPPADPEPIAAAPHVERELLPLPLLEKDAAAKPAVKEAFRVNVVAFDSPDEDVALEQADHETRVVLTGRVRTLTLNGVKDLAVVDASKLQAKRVVVRGAINGDADVIVHAVKVVFAGEINGSCRLDVKARDADFRGPVVGGVRVRVTLASGGSLSFARTDSGATLEYRKASPGDPAPKITRGQVKGGSRFGEKKQ